ncbi:response regulator transcription factor [Weissella diestrammenae]|uniref:Response regulator transcription factor n=1 Tax=Weissella diestrammenae TaxID=1162633 RepID=A0A7G9T7C5_9LACO|nr:response regulator transcription factor [Weissella diestrammenae]MCM0582013.1 response regulator transcription factor [Weissella diestrammenae]QNN76000.1 response regulator transcription factor [Weissella diestrammenae]
MANKAVKILIIEDDYALSDTIKETVGALGEIMQVYDGQEGLLEILSGVYDLVVLDVMLPSKDGFTVLKRVREDFPKLPILMLTAKGELEDKMRGFNLGADEYITKPFYKEELFMRAKTLLRHVGLLGDEGLLSAGNVEINVENHRVFVDGEEVSVQGREFGLLVYLMQHQEQIVTKDQIFDRLWGFDSDTSLTVVEVYMSNLRKNLRQAGANVNIKTLRNVGYTLNTMTEEN